MKLTPNTGKVGLSRGTNLSIGAKLKDKNDNSMNICKVLFKLMGNEKRAATR